MDYQMDDWGFFVDMEDIEVIIPSKVGRKPSLSSLPENKCVYFPRHEIVYKNVNQQQNLLYHINKRKPNTILIIYSKNQSLIVHILICLIVFFLLKQFM